MQKFSDSSRMKSQKLMKTSLKRNVKKISIGAVLLAVGFSSYAVIASDDSMVSSKGKGVSIAAAAGNTLYADNTADYGEGKHHQLHWQMVLCQMSTRLVQ